MSRRRVAASVALAASVAITGCAAGAADDRPQIVVTTNILGDVVERIAGDEAVVTTLMRPNADPHSFEISAQEAALMDSADLLVSNGLALEEGLQQHLDRAIDGGVASVVAGDHIDVLDYTADDAAGAPDPHFWTDPARMADVVDAVEAALEDVPGVEDAAIRAGADAYRSELAELDAEMTDAFAAIPAESRALVTNHHVFGYLADRYGFRIVGAVIPGGTTLAAPSAADLRGLVEAIDEAGVPTIFAESSQPDRLMQVLASEAGIEVEVVELYTESLTEPGDGADTYLAMMRANTERIAEGLTR
ncbi:zinc/manganese transport system substrate-binding protein [Microbacterium terrae]|uniref:Manganese ABC transporter substrate-binding lipoprotein n=1 Tax=Microbacterium terrae TaxID=69369 RepID=A0A0M2HEZ6_9MICO|nr:zinc ABC transporter substrate-binding protein AztC [Microbacterium terrae]KJL43291.1 Manganese ABC transporter substrate-binding lipoprotein precursor [Microbacterium terrae]MBP1078504.1 zinc/manganese transport system substrate-binding protein [Microbacterium terrae]GLJ97905.1 ABC transporter substrate-binding protein [Microbacterium terrae]